MEAGRYGSLGDTGSGNRFRPRSGAPVNGRGGMEEWLVECWSLHFPGWAQGRTAKTRVILVQIIIAFSIANKHPWPLQILLQAALWTWKRHFKHLDYPAAISLWCTEENCLPGIPTSHTKSASIGSFIFPRSWTQTDFKSPIKIFQSFNLAEYVFHKNCREGRQFIKLMFDQTCFIGLPIAPILRCNKMNSRTCRVICFWVLKTYMLKTDKKKSN